jgi:hypothetical protein
MTVQTASQNSRRGRFTASARTTKQIGVVHPVRRKGLHEGLRDLGLTNQFSERFRPVSTIESSNHALSLPGSSDPVRSVAQGEDSPRTHQSPVTLATFPS